MRAPLSYFVPFVAICMASCAPVARVPPDANITFTADPGDLPFDRHGARLRTATSALAGVTGSPLTLDLDVALLREYRSWFETGLVTAVENAAHDLGELKRTRPEMWGQMAPRLKTLSFRYDASAPKVTVKHDADRTSVTVTVPAKASTFLPHEAALLALEAEYDAGLPDRYAKGVPGWVSVPEKWAYFRALTGQKPPPKKPDDPAAAKGVANEARALSIERAIRFYDVAMPQDLKAAIHEWLLSEGNYFRDAYLVYPDAVKASPVASSFHRAEAAWVGWTQKGADRFTDLERFTLAKLVFVKQPAPERSPSRPVAFAFPGFDRMAFGLRVFEEWAQAGHPKFVPGRERLLELFDFIICPFELDNRGERTVPAICEHDFYGVAVETEAAQKKFLDFMLAQKDEVLVETALGNLMRMKQARAAAVFWRGIEAEENLWKAGTHGIADEVGATDTGKMQDEALRVWQTHPGRRGALLYLLSQIDRYGNDRVAWGAWSDLGGGRASAADFATFLGNGRRAFATAWVVWPLLGRGWSRADALVPGLDAFIDDPLVPSYHPQDPQLALQQIVSRMCAEKNFADLAKMHTYFVERIKNLPPGDKSFADLAETTTRGRCKPNARPVVRAEPLDAPQGRREAGSVAPSP
ncbi:MAG TPA: hypothetical protein VK550_25800 [Polyangiaceae bacterium]|nr:hypothetical protein [Polyangiaceae bacterium]